MILAQAKSLCGEVVVALGKPKEEAVLEELGASEDINYWRDGRAVHHVPKRLLRLPM